jgi:hypothetical protein
MRAKMALANFSEVDFHVHCYEAAIGGGRRTKECERVNVQAPRDVPRCRQLPSALRNFRRGDFTLGRMSAALGAAIRASPSQR